MPHEYLYVRHGPLSPVRKKFPKVRAASLKWASATLPFFARRGNFMPWKICARMPEHHLNNGPVYSGMVSCLWHGWRFSLRDGVCVNLPKAPGVATFPVTIQGEDLYVTLPPEPAKPS